LAGHVPMRRVILLAGLASCLLPTVTRAESPAPVEHRLYSPAGRFSLSASLGLSVFNGLTRTWTLTVGAGYDFKDWLGLDLRLGGALFSHTALADRIGQRLLQQPPSGDTVDDLSDLWTMRAFGLLGLRLAPIYGKFNLGPDFPVRFQLYLWLGGGAVWLHRQSVVVCHQVASRQDGTCADWLTEDRAAPAGAWALGLRLFTGRHGAVVLEVRDVIWKDRYLVGVDRAVAEAGQRTGQLASSPGFTGTVFFDAGYVVLF
jgi:outer membrane beta-barrel protein